MKIILSRKGFDSGSGGAPSPVLPDGTMVSLPIPDGSMRDYLRYDDIAAGQTTMGAIGRQLGIAERTLTGGAHLDPDLDPAARSRAPGWRPILGQAGAAASHLANQGVGVGDLFIFWGLYRHTVTDDAGLLHFDRSRPAFHAVFGWMTVGSVIRPGIDTIPAWADQHPHVLAPDRPVNTLYIAGDRCPLASTPAGLRHYSDHARLSSNGASCSRWALPNDCHPDRTGVTMSFHRDPARWVPGSDQLILHTVGRGQEFVVEATPAWAAWARTVLS